MNRCSLCLTEQQDLRHIPIYMNGSEGIHVCYTCDNALVNHCQAIRSVANRAVLSNQKNPKKPRPALVEAYIAHCGKWPEQLVSGVMFYSGQKISHEEWMEYKRGAK